MADYSDERVRHLLVNDLADNLGNLLMRVTSRRLVLPGVDLAIDYDKLPLARGQASEEDSDLIETLQQLSHSVGMAYDNYEFGVGLETVMACLRKVCLGHPLVPFANSLCLSRSPPLFVCVSLFVSLSLSDPSLSLSLFLSLSLSLVLSVALSLFLSDQQVCGPSSAVVTCATL